jgi:N-acetyl-anhydromuramyl-L-alanine amidase AmpD
MPVAQPKVDVTDISPNRSSRNGVKPRIIVLHATEGKNLEGLGDLRNLGSWFGQREAQVSSHVATDAEGHSARYVEDSEKAWHCMNANSYSLGIEQVGFTSQGSWPKAQIEATAQWVAYWSDKYDIPLTRSVASGVCTHKDLGNFGGNHGDPGAGFSVQAVIDRAKEIRNKKPSGKRPIKLTATEKKHVDNLRKQRRISQRNGGWAEAEKASGFDHRASAEESKQWLRDHATAMADDKVEDTEYRDRKVEFLRDVALNRNGRGM